MSYKSLLSLALLLLCSCSSEKDPYGSNGTYGQMNNDKDFGVVVSEQEKEGVNVQGIVNTTNGAGSTVAAGAASSAASQSAFFNPLSSLFNSNSNSTHTSDENTTSVTIQYVIKKTNGQQITLNQVPAEGEQIMYPGQKVMIQSNGTYVRVYPADVEDRFH